MNILQNQEFELLESIHFLDNKQKSDVLKYVKNQLKFNNLKVEKKKAINDVRKALDD